MNEQWAVKVEGKYELMPDEETARYEFKRWKGYGYDTEAVVKRQISDWVDVT